MRYAWVCGLVAGVLSACKTAPTGPYNPPAESARSTVEAERLNREAAELIQKEPERAEELLRRALTADLFFGPAHNNLGVLHLERGDLYEAAHEFEWARKLLPGHPDPRVNLALALERAGRTGEAFAAYQAALDVAPEYLPALQGAARLCIRERRDEERLPQWLAMIASGGDPKWADWARAQLSKER